MQKSEQVIYITLIDFLLQLLFLGLVLWVIFGLSQSAAPDESHQWTEDNAKIIDFVHQQGIHNAQELSGKAIVDRAGDSNQSAQIAQRVETMMRKAGATDPDAFLKAVESMVDATASFNGIDKVGRILRQLSNTMRQSNIPDADSVLAALARFNDMGGQSNTPPHIILSEQTQAFSFPSGSARLNPDFHDKLAGQVADDIQNYIDRYGINLIEVIGHTDSKPVRHGNQTIDTALETMAGQPYDSQHPPSAVQGSNTDLGMLRALEVVKLLRQLRGQGKLQGIDPDTGFRAYSSGQLTLPDGHLSDGRSREDDPARRRIEIRLTRLGERIQAR